MYLPRAISLGFDQLLDKTYFDIAKPNEHFSNVFIK